MSVVNRKPRNVPRPIPILIGTRNEIRSRMKSCAKQIAVFRSRKTTKAESENTTDCTGSQLTSSEMRISAFDETPRMSLSAGRESAPVRTIREAAPATLRSSRNHRACQWRRTGTSPNLKIRGCRHTRRWLVRSRYQFMGLLSRSAALTAHSRAEERIFRVSLRRDAEPGEGVAECRLPLIAEAHHVAALDPEQADSAVGICLLEADADPAVAVE